VQQSANDGLAAEVLSIRAELGVVNVASLRLGALLDQIHAASADADAALDAADEGGARRRGLTPYEAWSMCLRLQALVRSQRTALEQGQMLRDEARARLARCARRLEAAQERVDQLRTGGPSPDQGLP
jgi:hypothetical protein